MSEDIPKPDPINAELERDLFKRFWTWLAVVGTVVIVVVSGFSIIASQFVTEVINNRITKLDEQLTDLRKRTLDNVDTLARAAADAALNARASQQDSINASENARKAATGAQTSADSAQESARNLQVSIKSLPDVSTLLKNTDTIVDSLIGKKEFIDRINNKISEDVASAERSFNTARIIALVTVRSGVVVSINEGASFEPATGVIRFQNPSHLRIVPFVSYFSTNNASATESVFIKNIGPDFVTIWQGAQDTSARNHPPIDFTAVVMAF